MGSNGGAEQLADDRRCEPAPLEHKPTVRTLPIAMLAKHLRLVFPQDLREFFGVEIGLGRRMLGRSSAAA